jgi:hypothetical protein
LQDGGTTHASEFCTIASGVYQDSRANLMKMAVLTPILDDWPAFGRLVQEISSLLVDLPLAIEIVAVNDGSTQPFDFSSLCVSAGVIRSIEILHLGLNLGHQRAIAIDLAGRKDLDGVFVMDCDGEDRPADMPHPTSIRGRSSSLDAGNVPRVNLSG